MNYKELIKIADGVSEAGTSVIDKFNQLWKSHEALIEQYPDFEMTGEGEDEVERSRIKIAEVLDAFPVNGEFDIDTIGQDGKKHTIRITHVGKDEWQESNDPSDKISTRELIGLCLECIDFSNARAVHTPKEGYHEPYGEYDPRLGVYVWNRKPKE